jgi:hypothetical protein
MHVPSRQLEPRAAFRVIAVRNPVILSEAKDPESVEAKQPT